MAIQGVNFNNQLVSAKDFGALFAGILEDGIIRGCVLSFTGNTLTIGAGYLIIAGRLIRLTSNFSVQTQASGAVARVTVELDMTGQATETTFEQARIFVQYGANESSLPELVKNNINDLGTVYQMELCVLQVNQGNIESIISQKTAAPVIGATAAEAKAKADEALAKFQGVLKISSVNYGTSLPTAGTAGRVFFKKV